MGDAVARLSVQAPSFKADALNAMLRHRWPGNLIELEALLHRTLCLSWAEKLSSSDLGLGEPDIAIQPLTDAVEQFRLTYIERALAHFSCNRTQAAKALGIDVRTIFRDLEARKKDSPDVGR